MAGREPMPTTTRSASSSVPSDSTTFSTRSVPPTHVDPDAAAHVDALGAVQPGHQRADLLAEHRRQRRRLRFDQNDIHAEAAQARRHLASDEARADHDRAAAPTPACSRSAMLSSKDRKHPDALAGPETTECVVGTRPVAITSSSYSSSLPSASVTVCAAVSTERTAEAEQQRDVVLVVELGGLSVTSSISARSTSLDSGGRS